MAKRRARWTRDYAKQLLEEWHRSELSRPDFARSRGIDPDRLRRWQRRLDKAIATEAPRMVELVAATPRATLDCALKLRCPSGHVLEVTGVELAQGVRTLLAAVAGSETC